MPKVKWLIILGAVVAVLIGAGKSYHDLAAPRAIAQVVGRSTRPRYDNRTKGMREEHCVELGYQSSRGSERAVICDWDRHLENEMSIRYDPQHPDRAVPFDGTADGLMTLLLWSLAPFIGWLSLVMFVYAPLYERLQERRPRSRKIRR